MRVREIWRLIFEFVIFRRWRRGEIFLCGISRRSCRRYRRKFERRWGFREGKIKDGVLDVL